MTEEKIAVDVLNDLLKDYPKGTVVYSFLMGAVIVAISFSHIWLFNL